jgi:hypothetical protein
LADVGVPLSLRTVDLADALRRRAADSAGESGEHPPPTGSEGQRPEGGA